MLDEFQDTSIFQYDNFKPLLDNALASGFDNLVVGDVKQSIYRWRNSDWKILATDLERDFAHQDVHKFTLAFNYRSREQIIRFNNTVFQLAPALLAEEVGKELDTAGVNREAAEEAVRLFRNAYADAVQQFPGNMERSGGMVRLGFYGDDDDSSFREQVLSDLPGWIEEAQQSGVEPGEIAILVRTRKEGVMVADRLLEHSRITGASHKFRLISSESLLLAHNDAVSLLVSALYYLVYPEDLQNNSLLKYRCFQTGTLEKDKSAAGRLFDSAGPIDPWLPRDFVSGIALFRQMPLFELVETLISIFGLDEQAYDLPYIQAFQELVIELQKRETKGISDFLQYWELKGSLKGIQVSENSNAIRILTIHRSKGLEFKAVMIPFCNWEITTDQRKSNMIWCETRGTPFHRIPALPIRFSGDMKHTLFSEYYYQERMRGYLDSLNLMYVAFTRAADLLYLGVPQRADYKLKNMGDLLSNIQDLIPDISPALDALSSYREEDVIRVGALDKYEAEARVEDPWQFKTYLSNIGNSLPRMRMRSDSYFVDEEGVFRNDRVFGNMMHMVFSRIEYAEDLDRVLTGLLREGVLSLRDRPAIREKILEMISAEEVGDWFRKKEGRQVLNERSIMDPDGRITRPDRVIVDPDGVRVIDFKFGKGEKESYHRQVRQYMELLKEMGYPRVEGYLWYVSLGKIIQIDSL
jgi:ATP-dependent exoDNAse (exonuclease V) beta subunit